MATAFDEWLAQSGAQVSNAPAPETPQPAPDLQGLQLSAEDIDGTFGATQEPPAPAATPQVEADPTTPKFAELGPVSAVGAAVTYDTVLGWMLNSALSPEFTPDENFKLDEAKLNELGKGIPLEYWDNFNDAQSPAEANLIRQNMLKRMDAEKQLGEMGWGGFGARLTAQFLDAPTVAGSYAIGSIFGGGATTVFKANRLRRIMAAGIASGTFDAASQSYIYSQDPMGDPYAILYAGLAGSAFGSLGAGFAKQPGLTTKATKEIELQDIKDAGLPLTPKGEAYFAGVSKAPTTPMNEFIDVMSRIEGTGKNKRSSAVGEFQFIDSTFLDQAKRSKDILVKGLGDEEILSLKTDPRPEAKAFRRKLAENFTQENLERLVESGIEPNGTNLYLSHFLGSSDARKVLTADPDTPIEKLVRAKSIDSNPEVFKNIRTASDIQEWAEDLYARKSGGRQTAFAGVRYDMTSILKRDAENAPEWAEIGRYLAEDSVGNADNVPLAPTISLKASMLGESTLGDFLRTANRAYGDLAKSRGFNWLSRVADRNREEIMEEAGLAARGISPAGSKEIQDIANKWHEVSSQLLRRAKAAGVKGFENVSESETYVPRIWRPDKIAKMSAKYGVDELKLTVSEALARGLGMELKEAQAIINSSWRKIRQRDLGTETQLSMLLDGRNKDALIKQLQDEGIDKDIIDSIANKLTVKPEGTSPRAKHRMQLDESYVSPRTGLKLIDLVENDLERLSMNYVRHMSAQIAFAEQGFDGLEGFKSQVRKAVDASVDRGLLTDRQIKRRERIANTIASHVYGIPTSEGSTYDTIGQMLMQYNYVRLGGGFGMASIPEASEILASTGTRNFIQSMPSIRNVFRSLKDGKNVDLGFIRELESMGVAQDMTMARAFTRYDMWDGLVEEGATSKAVNATFGALNTGRKITGIASGLAPLTRFQQLWAGQSIVQNLARGNVKMNEKRLALLGLSPRDAKLIQDQLQKYSTFQRGVLGRNVKSINLDQFDDEQVADKLRVAVVRYVNRAIQKQDIGELPEVLVSSTTARILAQFKTFGIVAWSKKTLNAMHIRDVRAGLAVGLTSLMGGLVYSGQTYLNSLTKDNPEAYRAQRLSLENVIKAGVQRTGYASLMPMVADGAALATTGQSFFNPYARTSELPIDPVTGNPTYQLIAGSFNGQGTGILNSALSIPAKVAGSDYQFSRQDLQTIRNLLPWSTMMGMNQFYDSIGSSLPKRSE